MSIELKKLVLIERLMQIKEEDVLQQYERLLEQAQLQSRANDSLKAIDNGQVISLEAFNSSNQSWISKATK